MKRFTKVLVSSIAGCFLSLQAFGHLNLSVTGDTILSGTLKKTDDLTKGNFTSQGVSIFADYQIMEEMPMSLGLMGSFHNVTGTLAQAQREVAPTAKFWLGSDVTGIQAVQPFLRAGYAFSWMTNPAVKDFKTATNHGLILNVGNTFPISDTVSAVAAYTFNMRNTNVGHNGTDKKQTAMSHGASLGFSAELI